jgi:hypothetical protein
MFFTFAFSQIYFFPSFLTGRKQTKVLWKRVSMAFHQVFYRMAYGKETMHVFSKSKSKIKFTFGGVEYKCNYSN